MSKVKFSYIRLHLHMFQNLEVNLQFSNFLESKYNDVLLGLEKTDYG